MARPSAPGAPRRTPARLDARHVSARDAPPGGTWRRLGTDVVDGGEGDDVEIQLVATDTDGDTVTCATAADEEWIASHARIVDGQTVLDVGGKARALPQTDLSPLIQGAASS